MINKFFKGIAIRLKEDGKIPERYVELYAAAMQVMLAILVNLSTVLVLSGLLGMWWYGIILFAAFIPLRSYAGGYHAGGYISCYFESGILLTAILLILKYIIHTKSMVEGLWLFYFASVAVILMLAPLADENKPISEKEAIIFKKRARMILFLEAVVVGILAALHNTYCYAVMMAVMLSALLLLLHKGRDIVRTLSRN